MHVELILFFYCMYCPNLFNSKKVSLTLEKFNLLFKFKCLRSVCDPGEAVGLLAAQV